MRRSLWILAGFSLAVLAVIAPLARDARAQGDSTLHVGMVKTFFPDMHPVLIKFATEPFGKVMRDTTGLNGELLVGSDAFAVAQDLTDNKLQLGVFHGFEFAWVQKKFPEIKPLTIAVNSQRQVVAYVLVRKDNPAEKFANLRNKDISVPKKTKEHCRLFIEKSCKTNGAGVSKDYFAHVIGSANVETALDDLCEGKMDACVVDAIGLEFYKDLKPGCFNQFKILTQSEAFVPPVVAYREGSLDRTTLGKISHGLQSANKTHPDMMSLWKITSFAPIPANFDQMLIESIKAYPMPK